MFSAKPRPRWAAAAVAGAVFLTGLLAGCQDPQDKPGALSAPPPAVVASDTATPSASPSPSLLPSPSVSPSTVVVPPKTTTGTHSGNVVPGAYCPSSEHGWYGYSSSRAKYRCSEYDNGQWRWKLVSPAPTKAPTKKPTPKPTSGTHTHSGNVVPGAYCPSSEHGWYGYSSSGAKYRCSEYDNGQWRWKRV